MARTEPQPPFSAAASTGVAADPFLDLGRLLSRLEQNILRADGDRWRRLVNDEFQRLQARFDVAAARTLLARVEQTAATVKGHARRQAVQAELGRRRTVVERLQERLDDLDEEARAAAALAGDEEGDGSDSDDNDLSALDPSLAHILQQQQLATAQRREPAAEAGAALGAGQDAGPSQAEQEETTANSPRVGASASTPATATATATAQSPPQATLRPRRSRRIAGKGMATSLSPPSRSASSKRTAETATRAHTTATDLQQDAVRETKALRASLLGEDDPAGGGGGGGRNAVANEEVALDHHRREQEALSEDILRLARALKEKSLATARLLEDDKDVVDRVGEGLHSTNETLAAASRGMAALTRMTEGKGWLGRLMLYGMVYGLMLVLVLLFLFLPKLRL